MFYLKLAFNNIRQSFKQFAPFLLVSVTTFVFSTITLLIMTSPMAKSMGTGAFALSLATIVLDILAAILCLYSYNFLLKQRNQEFGLYNILGMNKRHITWVSTLELMAIYLATVVIGSLLSAVFSNLFYLIFVNLIQYDDLNFKLTGVAFLINIVLFAGIFFLLEFVNIIRIGRTSALNLFSNQSQGEREPRGNILLALLGIAAIGLGYYLSVTAGTVSALNGVINFFQAILAVIAGTYLFYISFITWYLKRRRKNKNYFYKPEHFITTSQMIFRMKQNAVGLANITLLAIMAFVTIFSTVALYGNTENVVKTAYPKNSQIEIKYTNNRQQAEQILQDNVLTPLQKAGFDSQRKFSSYLEADFALIYTQEANLRINKETTGIKNYQNNNIGALKVITQDDFRALGNKVPHLSAGEVAFCDAAKNMQGFQIKPFKTLTWFGQTYQNVSTVHTVNNVVISNPAVPYGILIVPDDTTMESMREAYNKNIGTSEVSEIYKVFANLTNKESQVLAKLAKSNGGVLYADDSGTVAIYSTENAYRSETLQIVGGFLFTGFLLGIAFLLGAALIIYYKQLSEGTQDKRSYKILQEVGMSLEQVKKTINSQILLVFFMPLAIAILHFVFALPILKKLLLNFGVQGDQFLYIVSALTVTGILLVYFVIYKLTSRTYYKIIER
ncbi:FtsX-like permease family protein [Streptococcus dentiloxodontae]